MTDRLIFFLDDFGTRTTCRPQDVPPEHKANELSFGLGGLIVRAEHVAEIGQSIKDFSTFWNVPELHGHKIRSGKGKFGFLRKTGNDEVREKFLGELESLILDDRITPHACVISRPGYRDRYVEKYQDGVRWEMSRTAFDIGIERAAKLAREQGFLLDVVYERTGKKEDRLIEEYFAALLEGGMGFDKTTSSKYSPMGADELAAVLNKIRPDGKSNPMLQLADLVLHPLCHITCGSENRAYNLLVERGMLIDARSEDEYVAVKYSCYDGELGGWKSKYQKQTGSPEGLPAAVGVKA